MLAAAAATFTSIVAAAPFDGTTASLDANSTDVSFNERDLVERDAVVSSCTFPDLFAHGLTLNTVQLRRQGLLARRHQLRLHLDGHLVPRGQGWRPRAQVPFLHPLPLVLCLPLRPLPRQQVEERDQDDWQEVRC